MGRALRLSIAAFSIALVGAGAAMAQEAAPDPPAPGTIVVTGRNTPEMQRRIRGFVEDVTRGNTGRQLARFERPVCPVAFGLPAEQRTLVARRMRVVAGAAGMQVAPDTCETNVIVAVVPDKRAFIDALLRREPGYFGDLAPIQIRRIAAQPGRTAAWQVNGPPISARGMEIFFDPSMDLYVNRTTEAGSRLYEGARQQFSQAIVVIERAALDGLTATQLADYAAMRAYASLHQNAARRFEGETILNVIDASSEDEVPVTLTAWDLGYLRGLYGATANLNISGQRAAIRQSVSRELGLQPN